MAGVDGSDVPLLGSQLIKTIRIQKWKACYFLVCDSIHAIAHYMTSSICPSVTWVDQSKTTDVRITQPSPQSSPMTLVS